MPKRKSLKASRRNRRNRQRGKAFEYDVEGHLRAQGYPAERIFYSGAGLKKPYDVEITWNERDKDILEIEAKRTFKDHISIQAKWLEAIHDRHVVVFAIGDARRGRGVVMKRYVIEQWVLATIRQKEINVTPFNSPLYIVKKIKRLREGDLKNDIILSLNEKLFLIRDFNEYMVDRWSNRLSGGG